MYQDIPSLLRSYAAATEHDFEDTSNDFDPEQEAAFYNSFLDQRELEGLTIANYEENTKRIIYHEE